MAGASSTLLVVADVAGGLSVAVVKFAAAAITGSSAMLAEGIHSLIDTGNGLLLWVGLKMSRRPADDRHPFGHGLELYFWNLFVAIFLFAIGGGMSMYEGIGHLVHPHAVEHSTANYVVLGCSAVFEAIVLGLSIREFGGRLKGRGVWATIHASKDPVAFTVLLENAAAMLGVTVAFVGVLLTEQFEAPWVDGVASILIGLILAAVSGVILYECRSLMLGEAVDQETAADIQRLVESDPAVEQSRRPLSMYFGPHEILVALDVQFRRVLPAEELERAVDRIESAVRQRLPQCRHIFLEAESITRTQGAE
jgi:cation diffusion facilitator family transporter